MSEEVALAAGDIAHWKRKAEQATALARELQKQRDQAEQDAADLRRSMSIMQDDHRRVLALLNQAEADAAALRIALELTVETFGIKGSGMPAVDARAADHPGATLLAELEAARAENAFLREWLRGELTLADADIDEAFVKARAE